MMSPYSFIALNVIIVVSHLLKNVVFNFFTYWK